MLLSISLEDIEACAEMHMYHLSCPVDWPPEPTAEEVDEMLVEMGMDLEEYHRWDHVGGTFATSDNSLCESVGHDLVDCSEAGPESGNMDHRCKRCGKYWHVPLY